MSGLMLAAGMVASLKSVVPGPKKVRQAAVAGMFYPSDAKTLTSMMDDMLAKVSPGSRGEPIVGLIVPHAGYGFSGPVAACGYAAIREHKYSRVVVIAPSHYETFSFTSVFDGDAYETPLGQLPVDKDFAKGLIGIEPRIRLSEKGHLPGAHHGEHALEVQLPWIQHVLGDVALVPVIMGDQSYSSARILGRALAKAIRETEMGGTLIVASSDLSHDHEYETAEAKDHTLLHAVEESDLLNLSHNIENGVWEACGGGAIVALMFAAEHLKGGRPVVLRYANSGDMSHDRSHVVGYGSVSISKKDNRSMASEGFELFESQRNTLLGIARKAIETMLRERKRYREEIAPGGPLRCRRGVFVTLWKRDQLRGCVGYALPAEPLFQAVIEAAEQAAFRDPRFPVVRWEELPELRVEISILGPLRLVLDVGMIRPGIDGLLVKKGRCEGLLLPQVALENGWDTTQFLEQTCVKAGLPKDVWKDFETDIYRFTALLFGEECNR